MYVMVFVELVLWRENCIKKRKNTGMQGLSLFVHTGTLYNVQSVSISITSAISLGLYLNKWHPRGCILMPFEM